VKLIFHNGTWTNTPTCAPLLHSGGTGTITDWTVNSRSATQYIWTFNGTPVAASTYEITEPLCSGR
jgi:hypothetical protein